MIFEEYIWLGESMPNVLLQAQISATKLNSSRRVCMLCLILSHILRVNALKEKV